MNVTFIGGGNMARAMLAALLRSGRRAEDLQVVETHPAAAERLREELGLPVAADAQRAVSQADVVVLAVKPQDMRAALQPLTGALQARRPVLLSVAAGLTLARLDEWSGGGLAIVRAMPNRPAFVGSGATGVFAGAQVTTEQRQHVEQILRASGLVVWLPDEASIDAVTALSGSGPAYFFLLAEAMTEAGRALGLAPEASRLLAIATLKGAGDLAAGSDGDLARLRAEVTSRGGTTEAALRVFDAAGLRDIVLRAMRAAQDRGRELGKD